MQPHAGYRIERVAGGPETTLRIARGAASGVIDLAAQAHGEVQSELAEISPGGRSGAWRIETAAFACGWPFGFAIVEDPDALSAFLLVGPNDAMIWVAGPLARTRATPIENLADDGQTVREVAAAGEDARIDLDYTIDDEAWWQRRYAVVWTPGDVLVVSAQARRTDEGATRVAVDLVAQSLAHVPLELQ